MPAKSRPAATPAPTAPKTRGWDDALLERALKVRQDEQLPWPAVAERIGVKSDALLSAKVRGKYGDAAAKLAPKPKPTAQPATQTTPAKPASAPAKAAPKRARRSKSSPTAKAS